MSMSNPRLSIQELIKLKFDEVQDIMIEREKNMMVEMGNLVKSRDDLKKEVGMLESSQSYTDLDKCSVEEKLGRSEKRCEELEEKIEKLWGEKLNVDEKLERSEGKCKELRSEKFDADQRMEELDKAFVKMEETIKKLRHEKLDVAKKLQRSERKCKELKRKEVEAGRVVQRKNVVDELRVKKMESDLEVRMRKVATHAKVLNVNLANLLGAMDKSAAAAAAAHVKLPDFVAEDGDAHAMLAKVRATSQDSGIELPKKGASVIRRCDLGIINKIKNNLGKENLERFEQSCFGHLLKINELKFQGQLMLQLLLHMDKSASNKERLVFKINNSNFEFGHGDFLRATGLRFGTSEATTTSSSSVHEDVFQGRTSIRLNDVADAFLKASRDHKGRGELTLKLALLYFLYGTLLANQRNACVKKLDLLHVHLVEDLEKFNAFPWGRVAYDFLVSSIFSLQNRLDVSKEKVLELHGFIFALQIWAYEVMPCVATYCASRAHNFDNLYPQILRWKSATKIIYFNDLKKFFEHLGLARCSSSAGEDVILISDSDDGIPEKSKRNREEEESGARWTRKRKRSTSHCSKSCCCCM